MWTLTAAKKERKKKLPHSSLAPEYLRNITCLIVGRGPTRFPCQNAHLLGFKWITLFNEHDYYLIAKSLTLTVRNIHENITIPKTTLFF